MVAQTAATEHEDLDVLRWLKENGCPSNRYFYCTWNKQTFANAAARGDCNMLRWMVVLFWFGYIKKCPCDESIFAGVANTGDLAIMNWLFRNGCPWGHAMHEFQAFNTSIMNNFSLVLLPPCTVQGIASSATQNAPHNQYCQPALSYDNKFALLLRHYIRFDDFSICSKVGSSW